MNKKEIKAKVTEFLLSGVAKMEVFTQLSGQGGKDKHLAYFIASYADPNRCTEHDRKVNVIIGLMGIQVVFAFLLCLAIGAKIGPNAKWIIAGLAALIPLLFAWGFYKFNVGTYNAFIFLSIIQLPKAFQGFTKSPTESSIGIAIAIGMIAYVWYVRRKLFPDFAFITPKKFNGQYVFTD